MFNLRKAKDALADYDIAIKLKPDYVDAYYDRALCKQYMNDMQGACDDWRKCKKLGKTEIDYLLEKCR